MSREFKQNEWYKKKPVSGLESVKHIWKWSHLTCLTYNDEWEDTSMSHVQTPSSPIEVNSWWHVAYDKGPWSTSRELLSPLLFFTPLCKGTSLFLISYPLIIVGNYFFAVIHIYIFPTCQTNQMYFLSFGGRCMSLLSIISTYKHH